MPGILRGLADRGLSVLMAMDGEKFCAYCPELDLVTEMDTYEETIEDMIEAIKDYANEYTTEFNLYSKSPNRAHHLPYIEAIRSCHNEANTISAIINAVNAEW
jgi:uncharacterized Fe-S radical SAM superfamily protein PflX